MTKKRTYVYSAELEELLKDIVYTLKDYFPNIDIERVKIVVCKDCRSRALARIYALPSVWRFVLG
ncbi:MAG: metallopeptidase, partial [Ignisphaera sp.]|nr:metallopeptidase [Ignisphaera sp.]